MQKTSSASTEALKNYLNDIKILENKFKNKVPFNLDIERCVLGSMLLNGEQQGLLSSLELHMFFEYKHAIALFYMKELMRHNRGLDFYTVIDHVSIGKPTHKNHRAYFETFSSYFNSLMTDSFAIKDLSEYVSILREKSQLRNLLLVSTKLCDTITEDTSQDSQEVIKQASSTFHDTLQKANSSAALQIISEVIPENLSDFLTSLDKKQKNCLGTGFSSLDNLLGGLMPGGVYIIAGRPSMGKTTLGMNIVESIIQKDQQKACLLFSLEMSSHDIVLRSLCSIARVNKAILHQGDMMPQNIYEGIQESYLTLRNANIYFHEEDLDLTSFILSSRKIKKINPNLSLIMIDYVQLMASQNRSISLSRQQEIADISRAAKLLAKELCLPVILVSQLNRNVDERMDRRPILSDLRESGALEQDADGVIFLYRDDFYNKDSVIPNKAEIIVSKNRHGARGTVIADFKGSQYRFQEEVLADTVLL